MKSEDGREGRKVKVEKNERTERGRESVNEEVKGGSRGRAAFEETAGSLIYK